MCLGTDGTKRPAGSYFLNSSLEILCKIRTAWDGRLWLGYVLACRSWSTLEESWGCGARPLVDAGLQRSNDAAANGPVLGAAFLPCDFSQS